jgi:hypothetical protein
MPITRGTLELAIATILEDSLDDSLNAISLNCSNNAFDNSLLEE